VVIINTPPFDRLNPLHIKYIADNDYNRG
jgi:hypothetical protein